jgi:hypothetical protein
MKEVKFQCKLWEFEPCFSHTRGFLFEGMGSRVGDKTIYVPKAVPTENPRKI